MATDARKAKAMTIREFYVNVLDLIDVIESDDPTGCVDTKVLAEKAHELIAKLDAQNEKRKNAERKPSAKQIAQAEYDAKLMEAIESLLTDEFQSRTVFAEALDITPSKASTLLNKMEKSGIVEKGEIKGEKGKQVGYKHA